MNSSITDTFNINTLKHVTHDGACNCCSTKLSKHGLLS